MLDNLKDLYHGSVDAVELFVGGMLLSKNGEISEIFKIILREQFISLRDSDRFWFENAYNGCNFTDDEIQDVKKSTLASVFKSNGIDVTPIKSTNLFVQDALETKCQHDNVKDRSNMPECGGN